MLQQWRARWPQVSVGTLHIKHNQFLQVLAVQCRSVLRGSAQISTYCMPRCLVGEAWPGQPVTGETDRPRKRRSMEGRRGFRRLTGQKAEPPWGVKLTLLGSGQDGWRRGSSWQADLRVKRWREWSASRATKATALHIMLHIYNSIITIKSAPNNDWHIFFK